MNHTKHFSFTSRIKSFKYAFTGLKTLFQAEPNAWIHISAAVITVGLGFFCRINSLEWLFVITAIALVIAAELINTALEVLCDFVQPEKHEAIKKVKDLAAGAVLVLSAGAFLGGLILFIPKLISILS